MKFCYTICIAGLMAALPQLGVAQQVVYPQGGTVQLLGEFTFTEVTNSFDPNVLNITEAPKPTTLFGERKQLVDRMRQERVRTPRSPFTRKAGGAINPTVSFVTMGQGATGTPNDNDMAVSDSGLIVSVLNSNMRVLSPTGQILKNFTLRGLGKIPGMADNTFDPRVVYDPVSDRFIIVFLSGRDETSRTFLCFSKTNDPTKEWFAYSLPGSNIFVADTWTDYPIISITEEDLFITLNIVRNNTDWRVGFYESMIWQVGKKEGYIGDTAIKYNKWNNIKWGAGPLRSICPAQGGMKPGGPNAYFLSVRPTDLQNDSMFLTEISNTLSSGMAVLTVKMLKTSRAYGFPPNAPQPNGQWLSTNDGRVLTAMVQNGVIQFAGNTVDTNFYTASVFHGHFKVTDNTATLNIISSDTVDYGFPDIAYAGNGEPWDNSAILTFSRVSKVTPSGTSVMYIDRNFNYSDEVIVRNGIGPVNVLTDTLERWGDYTGIQRKYNENRTFWLCGSIGFSGAHGTVVAKVTNTDPALSVPMVEETITETKIFPNPAVELVSIEFELAQKATLTFNLYDINGKLVSKLTEEKVKAGVNKFTFNTLPLPAGVYILAIEQGNQRLKNEKIIVSH